MSHYASIQLGAHEDRNRKATPQELAAVPRMTKADARSVMKTADYKRSKLAQELIAASIAKGYLDETTETGYESAGEIERRSTGDELAAKHATVKALFADPRYRHDAAYRYEVSQKIAALTANDGDTVSYEDFHTPNRVIRTSLSPMAHKGSDLTVMKHSSIQLEAIPTPAEKPASTKPTKEAFE